MTDIAALPSSQKSEVISNIQLLRAFAALSVVFYHTDYRLVASVHTDFQGVSLFFVISGFIMSYIAKYETDRFLLRRLVRIVPLYWLLTLYLYYPNIIGNAPYLLKSMFFFPYINTHGDYFPALGVGWTLNLEMMFYVLLALMMKINRPLAPILTCGVLMTIKLIDAALAHRIILFRVYSHSYVSFFIMGIFAYYIWMYLKDRLGDARRVLIVAASVMGGIMLAVNIFAVPVDQDMIYLMPFGLVLMALLLHSAGIRCSWKPLLVLGNASYSLYLVHTFWIEKQRAMAVNSPYLNFSHTFTGMITVLVVSCVLAVILHYLIEKPVIRFLHRAFKLQRA